MPLAGATCQRDGQCRDCRRGPPTDIDFQPAEDFYVLITVTTTGRAWAGADIASRQVFEPFFTTKGPADAGTGFGVLEPRFMDSFKTEAAGHVKLYRRTWCRDRQPKLLPAGKVPENVQLPNWTPVTEAPKTAYRTPGAAGGKPGEGTVLVVEKEGTERFGKLHG